MKMRPVLRTLATFVIIPMGARSRAEEREARGAFNPFKMPKLLAADLYRGVMIASAATLLSLLCASCAGVGGHAEQPAKHETLTGRIYYQIVVEPEARPDPVTRAAIQLDQGGVIYVTLHRKSEATIPYTLADGDRIQFVGDPEQLLSTYGVSMSALQEVKLLEVAPKKPDTAPAAREKDGRSKRDGAKGPWAPPPGFVPPTSQ